MSQYLIYGLFCPISDNLHYIGKSSVYMTRPLQHMNESHNDKIREWVEELKILGYIPKIKILEYCFNAEQLDEKEKFWIYKSIKEGCYLLNQTHVTAANLISHAENLFTQMSEDIDQSLATIAAFIKAQRKLHNLTQVDLSQKSGVGLKTIRKIEQCENYNLQSLLNVLRLFNTQLTIKKKTL